MRPHLAARKPSAARKRFCSQEFTASATRHTKTHHGTTGHGVVTPAQRVRRTRDSIRRSPAKPGKRSRTVEDDVLRNSAEAIGIAEEESGQTAGETLKGFAFRASDQLYVALREIVPKGSLSAALRIGVCAWYGLFYCRLCGDRLKDDRPTRVVEGAALFHRLLSRSFIRVYVRGHSLFSAFLRGDSVRRAPHPPLFGPPPDPTTTPARAGPPQARSLLDIRGVRLFIEDFSPYSWALLPADASPQWPFREGHQAGQRVPASFRQPAEPRHGAEHLRSSPRQARSLLDIRAAFWYGAVGREAGLRWL